MRYYALLLVNRDVRNHIRRMGEHICHHIRTQHVFHIKRLSTLKPLGVVGVDRKACRHTCLLMNPLRPDTNVRKRAALVKSPAVDVVSVMQLVKDLEPVM